VLVTGATGFVGKKLCSELSDDGYEVYAAVRKRSCGVLGKIHQVEVPDLTEFDWSDTLKDINVVIHAAARVHQMNDNAVDSLNEFRCVNTVGTMALARQAIESGVKRFIFLSSIKVNGEVTKIGQPFIPSDNSIPIDPYGLSKYEAEQGLLKLAQETAMEVVIIRPPLVYGPNVRANFASMIHWVNKGVPLPFGAVNNLRSFVALDNLVDFIIHCIHHPKAVNEIFLISDGDDVSITELLKRVANAYKKKILLLPVPAWLMRFLATLVGKDDIASRLLDDLQVDSSKCKDLLGWEPVTSMDEQLAKMMDVYLNEKGS